MPVIRELNESVVFLDIYIWHTCYYLLKKLKLTSYKVGVFLFYHPEYMINCTKNEQFEVNENYQQLFLNFFNNLKNQWFKKKVLTMASFSFNIITYYEK